MYLLKRLQKRIVLSLLSASLGEDVIEMEVLHLDLLFHLSFALRHNR